MARWDDLHRAIEARDTESAERVWLELLETDLEHVDRFLDAAGRLAGKSGGQAPGRHPPVDARRGAQGERQGSKRTLRGLRPARPHGAGRRHRARRAWSRRPAPAYPERRRPGRPAREERGAQGGPPSGLAAQAETLASYLRLEPGTYVFHSSGWGTGRIVDYLPERGRCVIDFDEAGPRDGHRRGRRAPRAARRGRHPRHWPWPTPSGLSKWAAEAPLEMIRQVLVRGSTAAPSLRHIKDALVPDAVATSRWTTWWKEAQGAPPRSALPRERRADPVLEYHGTAGSTSARRSSASFRGCATVEARQRAAARVPRHGQGRPGGACDTAHGASSSAAGKATLAADASGLGPLLADLAGGGERADVRRAFDAAADERRAPPEHQGRDVRSRRGPRADRRRRTARDDGLRRHARRRTIPSWPTSASTASHPRASPSYVPRLLDTVDAKPAIQPNLWAWYVRGLRRNRWDGRPTSPTRSSRACSRCSTRSSTAAGRRQRLRDKRGVTALVDMLTSQERRAREGRRRGDRQRRRASPDPGRRAEPRHQGPRSSSKIQTIILRARPRRAPRRKRW